MRSPVIVVAAALANRPHNGGGAWVRLSWTRGLERLGCRVYFVEEISEAACVDDEGRPAPFERSVNLAWFREVVAGSELADRSALVCVERGETAGMSMQDILDVADEADLLLNLTGHLRRPSLLKRFRRKAYLDLDPGFTQIWHATGEGGVDLDGHDLFFTVGENIGTPGCGIPSCGVFWRPVRQPVVLDDWPVVRGEPDVLTTVASWRGPFGPVDHGGRRYGVKAHEFRRFIDIPRRAPQTFEIALEIHPADDPDRDLLRRAGWRLTDPRFVAGDPGAYRDYVQRSGAEFSVAKGIYAATNSGWFSDRSVRYLASGKPVLVQDTGFRRNLPTGDGLIAFSTLDEAVAGAESIADRYDEHAAAARRVAQDHFDSDRVLTRLLEDAGVAA